MLNKTLMEQTTQDHPVTVCRVLHLLLTARPNKFFAGKRLVTVKPGNFEMIDFHIVSGLLFAIKPLSPLALKIFRDNLSYFNYKPFPEFNRIMFFLMLLRV